MKIILPTLGDIANGIFAVLIVCFAFGVPLVWWYLVVGILFALLPDIDALPEVMRHGQVGKRQADGKFAVDHRVFLHYPILYLAVGLVICAYSLFWGVLFLLAVSLHFMRDLVGTGWGVRLFWPFSKRSYKFFTAPTNAVEPSSAEVQPVVSWSDQEMEELVDAHGDEDWLEKTYLRLTWISGIEYSLFIVAIGLVVYTLLY